MHRYVRVRSGCSVRPSTPTCTGFLLLALTLLLPVVTVFGQPRSAQNPVSLRSVDAEKVRTPVFEAKGPARSVQPEEWLRLVCEYDCEQDWLDEVTFQFYVAVRGKTRDVPPVSLFRGEVTYINVAKGRRLIADMFLHPDVLARFGELERVAVLMRADGRVVDMKGKPEITARWWEQFSPVEGVLMTRDRTPFLLIDYDAYPMIRAGGR